MGSNDIYIIVSGEKQEYSSIRFLLYLFESLKNVLS